MLSDCEAIMQLCLLIVVFWSSWGAVVLQVGTVRMHFCGSDGVVHDESSEGWEDVLCGFCER